MKNEEEIPLRITQETPYELNVALAVGESYAPSTTYTLTIQPFLSMSEKNLADTLTMVFTTADALHVNIEFLPRVPAVTKEQYNGQALVTFSYDDGYMNWYSKALPYHSKYAMPGTFNINGSRIYGDDPHFMKASHVWVADSLGIEIGAHTQDHKALTTLTDEDIIYQVATNIAVLEDLGIPVHTLAAPYSDYDERVYSIVSDYFEGVRVYDGVTNQAHNYDRYWLKAKAVKNYTTVEDIQGWIDEAIQERSGLIIMLHNVVDDPIEGCANGADECDELYDTSPQVLEGVMQYINAQGKDTLLPVNTYEGIQLVEAWEQ